MTRPWITVVGIGADGLVGLSNQSRALIADTDLLVGGVRHQAMVDDSDLKTGVERLTWSCGIAVAVEKIGAWRGRNVVVLVSGDPMYFGAGATLARHFDSADMHVIPCPGAFSLACARMVWSVPDTVTMTVHGRAHETLNLHTRPGARIVALSCNGESPAILARLLSDRGFGDSRMTVFSNMGTDRERHFDGTANAWKHDDIPDLNTVCIDCVGGPDAVWWPRVPGLPEEAFVHDNQITKREVRAATLALLAPEPGKILWDVGAGCGSISIEWLRSTDGTQAHAIEYHAARLANIDINAKALGVPRLNIVKGKAPAVLKDLPDPDVVFVGGGVSDGTVLTACWDRLPSGGLLVANAVTLEAQEQIMQFGQKNGGSFTRLQTARSGAVGRLTTMRPMMEVLQLVLRKTVS